MRRPPPPSRARPAHEPPTWRGIVAGYVVASMVPIGWWLVSRPLLGVAVIGALVAVAFGGRRTGRLARCLRRCERLTVQLGGVARVTVTRPPAEDPN